MKTASFSRDMDPATRFSVVIVDDEIAFARLLRSFLLRSFPGSLIEMFRQPADALDHIIYAQPHLVITDYYMPGINGVELAQALQRSMPDHCPRILAATARPLQPLELGNFDGYFAKPFRMSTIVDPIACLFGGVRRGSQPPEM